MPSQWHVCQSHLWLARACCNQLLLEAVRASPGDTPLPGKILCIFCLPGLKLRHTRWTTACLPMHILGKKYSNWRLKLSLKAKLVAKPSNDIAALSMESGQVLLKLKCMCDKDVFCESEGCESYLLRSFRDVWGLCQDSMERWWRRKFILYLLFIFYNVVRILEPWNFRVDFSGGLVLGFF